MGFVIWPGRGHARGMAAVVVIATCCLLIVTRTAAASATSGADAVNGSTNRRLLQTGTIGLWQQCGGKGNTGAGNCGRSGYGPCIDAAWTSPTCASGSRCVRDNEWWWQCEPSTTSGGTTTTTTTTTSGTIQSGGQCGGKGYLDGGNCGRTGYGPCVDAAWTSPKCASGLTCVRSNEWWWSCQGTTTGGSTDGTTGGTTTTTTGGTIQSGGQCGGKGYLDGGNCGRTGYGPCVDATWTSPKCASGLTCVRSNEWWWSCQGSTSGGTTGGSTGGTIGGSTGGTTTTGANGCPSGWLPAIGTVYDSWPKAGSSECSAFNGCTWAGQFALINGGSPPTCLRGAQPLQAPNGGPSTVACRFPEATVRSMNIASTWENDGSGLRNTRLRVMAVNNPAGASRTVTVDIRDVCSDRDCSGCCSANTGGGRWPMIDLEKWPAASLLGFDGATADVNNLGSRYPAQGGLRPGAPSYVMALCYQKVQDLAPAV